MVDGDAAAAADRVAHVTAEMDDTTEAPLADSAAVVEESAEAVIEGAVADDANALKGDDSSMLAAYSAAVADETQADEATAQGSASSVAEVEHSVTENAPSSHTADEKEETEAQRHAIDSTLPASSATPQADAANDDVQIEPPTESTDVLRPADGLRPRASTTQSFKMFTTSASLSRSRAGSLRAQGGSGPGASFAVVLSKLVNGGDVSAIIDNQTQTMGIYRDVNERLATFNDFSQKRFGQLVRQFEGHTRMLVAMKSDLDQIFRRIRTLQTKLARQYPGAFEHVDQSRPHEGEEDD